MSQWVCEATKVAESHRQLNLPSPSARAAQAIEATQACRVATAPAATVRTARLVALSTASRANTKHRTGDLAWPRLHVEGVASSRTSRVPQCLSRILPPTLVLLIAMSPKEDSGSSPVTVTPLSNRGICGMTSRQIPCNADAQLHASSERSIFSNESSVYIACYQHESTDS